MLASANKFLDLAVSDWRFNDITISQNGAPMPISQSTNYNSALGNSTQRPTIVPGINPASAAVRSRGSRATSTPPPAEKITGTLGFLRLVPLGGRLTF